jgi:hypothetical protein
MLYSVRLCYDWCFLFIGRFATKLVSNYMKTVGGEKLELMLEVSHYLVPISRISLIPMQGVFRPVTLPF